MDYIVHGQKGNFGHFESSIISETGEATPTKIGVHAYNINPYLLCCKVFHFSIPK